MRDAHAQGAGHSLLTAAFHATSEGPEATRELAARLGRLLAIGDVVLLEGGLGSGKTVFAQGLARGMGLRATVKSPTFTLLHEYRGSIPLAHVDLYRIPAGREASDLPFDELRERAALAIEWGGRVEAALPDHVRVDLEGPEAGGPADVRRLVFAGRGARGAALVEELAQSWERAERP